jgi:AraC family transcriptional regulator
MNTQSISTQVCHNGFSVELLTEPPGLFEAPGQQDTRVAIHAGPPVPIACRRAGLSFKGVSVHGDIYIIPADTPITWEIKGNDTFLRMNVALTLLQRVAEEMGHDSGRIEIRNRFQVRDTQLENIAWALKEEMECGFPCGQLYFDSLAVAVAARLLCYHSSQSRETIRPHKRLTDRRLRRVFDYIEDHLAENIALDDLATVVNLSVSHFTVLFREATGLSPHQYVIRRRIERARSLLGTGELTIREIASETGFAHQSHLARHMQRVLGVSPKTLREMLR